MRDYFNKVEDNNTENIWENGFKKSTIIQNGMDRGSSRSLKYQW